MDCRIYLVEISVIDSQDRFLFFYLKCEEIETPAPPSPPEPANKRGRTCLKDLLDQDSTALIQQDALPAGIHPQGLWAKVAAEKAKKIATVQKYDCRQTLPRENFSCAQKQLCQQSPKHPIRARAEETDAGGVVTEQEFQRSRMMQRSIRNVADENHLRQQSQERQMRARAEKAGIHVDVVPKECPQSRKTVCNRAKEAGTRIDTIQRDIHQQCRGNLDKISDIAHGEQMCQQIREQKMKVPAAEADTSAEVVQRNTRHQSKGKQHKVRDTALGKQVCPQIQEQKMNVPAAEAEPSVNVAQPDVHHQTKGKQHNMLDNARRELVEEMRQKIQEQKMKVPAVEAKTSLGVAQADMPYQFKGLEDTRRLIARADQMCQHLKEQEEKLEREQKQKRQVDELLANPPDLIRDFIESIKRVVKQFGKPQAWADETEALYGHLTRDGQMRARAKEAQTCVETVQDTHHLTKGKQHKTRATTNTCGEQMCQQILKVKVPAAELETTAEVVQQATLHQTKGKQHKTRGTTSTGGEQMCQEIQKQKVKVLAAEVETTAEVVQQATLHQTKGKQHNMRDAARGEQICQQMQEQKIKIQGDMCMPQEYTRRLIAHADRICQQLQEQEERLEREQKQKCQVDELLANPPDLIRDFIESIKRVVKQFGKPQAWADETEALYGHLTRDGQMRARAKEAETCVETVQDTQHLTKGNQHKTRDTARGEQMWQQIQEQEMKVPSAEAEATAKVVQRDTRHQTKGKQHKMRDTACGAEMCQQIEEQRIKEQRDMPQQSRGMLHKSATACEEIIDSGNSGRKEAERPVTVVQGTKESIPDEEHLRRKERRERRMKAKAVAAAASTAVKQDSQENNASIDAPRAQGSVALTTSDKRPRQENIGHPQTAQLKEAPNCDQSIMRRDQTDERMPPSKKCQKRRVKTEDLSTVTHNTSVKDTAQLDRSNGPVAGEALHQRVLARLVAVPPDQSAVSQGKVDLPKTPKHDQKQEKLGGQEPTETLPSNKTTWDQDAAKREQESRNIKRCQPCNDYETHRYIHSAYSDRKLQAEGPSTVVREDVPVQMKKAVGKTQVKIAAGNMKNINENLMPEEHEDLSASVNPARNPHAMSSERQNEYIPPPTNSPLLTLLKNAPPKDTVRDVNFPKTKFSADTAPSGQLPQGENGQDMLINKKTKGERDDIPQYKPAKDSLLNLLRNKKGDPSKNAPEAKEENAMFKENENVGDKEPSSEQLTQSKPKIKTTAKVEQDVTTSGRKEAEHPVTVVQGTKESIPDEEHLRRKERRERRMKAKAVAAAASTAVKKQDSQENHASIDAQRPQGSVALTTSDKRPRQENIGHPQTAQLKEAPNCDQSIMRRDQTDERMPPSKKCQKRRVKTEDLSTVTHNTSVKDTAQLDRSNGPVAGEALHQRVLARLVAVPPDQSAVSQGKVDLSKTPKHDQKQEKLGGHEPTETLPSNKTTWDQDAAKREQESRNIKRCQPCNDYETHRYIHSAYSDRKLQAEGPSTVVREDVPVQMKKAIGKTQVKIAAGNMKNINENLMPEEHEDLSASVNPARNPPAMSSERQNEYIPPPTNSPLLTLLKNAPPKDTVRDVKFPKTKFSADTAPSGQLPQGENGQDMLINKKTKGERDDIPQYKPAKDSLLNLLRNKKGDPSKNAPEAKEENAMFKENENVGDKEPSSEQLTQSKPKIKTTAKVEQDVTTSGRKEAEHPVTVVQGTKESIPDEEHLRRKERRERRMKAKAVAAAASTTVKQDSQENHASIDAHHAQGSVALTTSDKRPRQENIGHPQIAQLKEAPNCDQSIIRRDQTDERMPPTKKRQKRRVKTEDPLTVTHKSSVKDTAQLDRLNGPVAGEALHQRVLPRLVAVPPDQSAVSQGKVDLPQNTPAKVEQDVRSKPTEAQDSKASSEKRIVTTPENRMYKGSEDTSVEDLSPAVNPRLGQDKGVHSSGVCSITAPPKKQPKDGSASRDVRPPLPETSMYKGSESTDSSGDSSSDEEDLAASVNSLKTVKSQLGSDNEAGNSSSLSLPGTPKIVPPKDGSPSSDIKPPEPSSSSADTAVSSQEYHIHNAKGQLKEEQQGKYDKPKKKKNKKRFLRFFRIKKKDHSKGASRSKGKKAKSNNTGNTIDEVRLSGHMKQSNPQKNITTPKVEGNAKDKPTKTQISKASREEKVLKIPQSSMYKGTDSSEDLSSDEEDMAVSVNSLKTVKSQLGSDHGDVSPSSDVKPAKRDKPKKKKSKKPFLRFLKSKKKGRSRGAAKSNRKNSMSKETDIIDEEPPSTQKKQSKVTTAKVEKATKDSESSKDLSSDAEDLAVTVNSLKTVKSQLGSDHEDVSPSSDVKPAKRDKPKKKKSKKPFLRFLKSKKKGRSRGAAKSNRKNSMSKETDIIDEEPPSTQKKQSKVTTPKVEKATKDSESSEDLSSDAEDLAVTVNSLKTVKSQRGSDHEDVSPSSDVKPAKRDKPKKKKSKKPFLRFLKSKKKGRSRGAAKSNRKNSMSKETDIIDEEPPSTQKKQSKVTTPKVEKATKDSESSEDLSSDAEDLAVTVNSLKTVKSQLGSDHEDVSPSSDVKPAKRDKPKKKKSKKPFLRFLKSKKKGRSRGAAKSNGKKSKSKETDIIDEEVPSTQKRQSKVTMPKVEKETKDSESSEDLSSDEEDLAVSIKSLKTLKSQLGSDHEAGNSSSPSLPRTPKIAPSKDGSPSSDMKPPKPSSSSADTAVSGQEYHIQNAKGQLKDEQQGDRNKAKKKRSMKKSFLRLFRTEKSSHSKHAFMSGATSKNTENTIDEEIPSTQKKQSKVTMPKVEKETKDSESSEDLSSDAEDLAVTVNSLKTVKSQLGSDHEDVSPSSDVKPAKLDKPKKKKSKKPFLRFLKSKKKGRSRGAAKSNGKKSKSKETDIIDEEVPSTQKRQSKVTMPKVEKETKDRESSEDLSSDEEDLAVSIKSLKTVKSQLGSDHEAGISSSPSLPRTPKIAPSKDGSPSSDMKPPKPSSSSADTAVSGQEYHIQNAKGQLKDEQQGDRNKAKKKRSMKKSFLRLFRTEKSSHSKHAFMSGATSKHTENTIDEELPRTQKKQSKVTMPKVEKETKDSESSEDLSSDEEDLAVSIKSLKTVKSQLGSDHKAGISSSPSLPRTPKIAPPKDGSPSSDMKPPKPSSSSADTAVSGQEYHIQNAKGQLKDEQQGDRNKAKKKRSMKKSFLRLFRTEKSSHFKHAFMSGATSKHTENTIDEERSSGQKKHSEPQTKIATSSVEDVQNKTKKAKILKASKEQTERSMYKGSESTDSSEDSSSDEDDLPDVVRFANLFTDKQSNHEKKKWKKISLPFFRKEKEVRYGFKVIKHQDMHIKSDSISSEKPTARPTSQESSRDQNAPKPKQVKIEEEETSANAPVAPDSFLRDDGATKTSTSATQVTEEKSVRILSQLEPEFPVCRDERPIKEYPIEVYSDSDSEDETQHVVPLSRSEELLETMRSILAELGVVD